MSVTLRVLTGARAGLEQTFDKSVVTVGRHPMCDLRFDPDADRDVSARHAEIRAAGDAWVLRDSGSTNGTFVGGARITGERPLREGDVVAFGEYGPTVAVRALVAHSAPEHVLHRSPAPRVVEAVAAPAAPPFAAPSRPPTAERIAVAVDERTRGLRRTLGAAAALLIVIAVGTWWLARRDEARRTAEIQQLLRRNDSLSATFDREMARLSGAVAGLDSALAAARDESATLRRRLADAGSDADVAALASQLARVETRRSALASLDNTAIARANAAAVALLAVQMPDGRSYTGTAFAVTPGGLLVTNRHLVRDDDGRDARHLLVKFSGARRWVPARIARVPDGDDLALLQVEGAGPFPAVAGIARTDAVVGAPVAILGFPLGMETAMEAHDGDDFVASATLGVGTASKVVADVLQIDAFAGEGSSGSPVFDRSGRVAGVVFGGARESAGRIVYAIPAARLLAVLPAEARR